MDGKYLEATIESYMSFNALMMFSGRFFSCIALIFVMPGAFEFLSLLNEYLSSWVSMGLVVDDWDLI